MIELRHAESDEDLEAWRSVRSAILPNERTASVAELRAAIDWDTLFLLAFVDGELAGSGIANGASTGGAFTHPRVLPAFRRRGVGTALLTALADQALASGHDEAGSQLEEPGSAAFAARFGFVERNRQIEQVYVVRGDETEVDVPDGITIVPLRGRADRVPVCTASSSRPRSPTSPSTGRSRSPKRSGGRAGSRPMSGHSSPSRARSSSAWPACSTTSTIPSARRTS